MVCYRDPDIEVFESVVLKSVERQAWQPSERTQNQVYGDRKWQRDADMFEPTKALHRVAKGVMDLPDAPVVFVTHADMIHLENKVLPRMRDR